MLVASGCIPTRPHRQDCAATGDGHDRHSPRLQVCPAPLADEDQEGLREAVCPSHLGANRSQLVEHSAVGGRREQSRQQPGSPGFSTAARVTAPLGAGRVRRLCGAARSLRRLTLAASAGGPGTGDAGRRLEGAWHSAAWCPRRPVAVPERCRDARTGAARSASATLRAGSGARSPRHSVCQLVRPSSVPECVRG